MFFMKLLNVRLSPEDASLLTSLRRQGIQISQLVRGAIRAAASRGRNLTAPGVDRALTDIYAKHPDPPGQASLPVESRDRRAVREHVQRRLRRTHRS
jgi:hypothetical protein